MSNPARDLDESRDLVWTAAMLAMREQGILSMRALGIRLSYKGRMVNA